MLKKWCVGLLCLTGLLFIPSGVRASGQANQFVTIINPVRISGYNPDPVSSLTAEYGEVSNQSLKATWLYTYDALMNDGVMQVAKNMTTNQEQGVFLEITPQLAQAAGVTYHQTDSWHRAKSLLLVGYTPAERLKLIDTYFQTFKSKFGVYPSATGAWWVDAYSLNYLQQKYHTTTHLGLADQYSTDGYQVWGQWWSTPFYPATSHSGMPAHDTNHKIDVVSLQWAPRDPWHGYGVGQASLYSTQDYPQVHLTDSYFESLLKLYAWQHNNQFGQMVVGLEADLPADIYHQSFRRQLAIVKKYQQNGELQDLTAAEFGQWYKKAFPVISPAQMIESDDLLGNGGHVLWYNSPNFRIGISSTQAGQPLQVFDFRTYHSDIFEPYYFWPDQDSDLYIYLPSLIDTTVTPLQQKTVSMNWDQIRNQLEKGQLPWATPTTASWYTNDQGYLYTNVWPERPLWLRMRRGEIELVVGVLLVIGIWIFIFKWLRYAPQRLIVVFISMLGILCLLSWWIFKIDHHYFVSQSEVDALHFLAQMPPGSVLVEDRECLNCSWPSVQKPAVFANKRGYVTEISHHPLVMNQKVFQTDDREIGRKALQATHARYIYVVRYGDYQEKLPFSPGDYGVEEIYQNAAAEVWQLTN